MMGSQLHVIVLAGGRSARMGGFDKAQVLLNGKALYRHILEQIYSTEHITLVSPLDLHVPDHIRIVSEHPPYGGPVAGIAAGFDSSYSMTAVLAVDAPHSAALIPKLFDALSTHPNADLSIVEGQYLCALWHTAALARALNSLPSVRDQAARCLVQQASPVVIPADNLAADYDTVEELRQLGDVELA